MHSTHPTHSQSYGRKIIRAYKRVMYSLWWIPNSLSGFRGFVASTIIAFMAAWELFAVTLNGHSGLNPVDIFGEYWPFLFWLTVAGTVSDGLDGFFAKSFKRYGWQTEKGGELDAYCDKFFGAAVLYMAIPFHHPLGLYLIPYSIALVGILRYSHTTTQMRWKRLIRTPNKLAQWKTAVLMSVKVVAVGNIAFIGDNQKLLWACVAATVLAWVMCIFALRQYKEAAKQFA